MTFLELCNAVRADANVQGTIPAVTGQTHVFANIVRWVQESYLEIQAEEDNWNFLRIEDSIALPVLFRDSDLSTKYVDKLVKGSLRLADDTRLQFMDYPSFSYRFPLGSTKIKTAKPTFWSQLPADRDKIRLDAFPAVEETMYFEAIRVAYELTNNTDTPVWATKYHTLIKWKALEKYASYYNAQEVFQLKSRDYQMMMSRFRYDYLPKNFYHTVPFA